MTPFSGSDGIRWHPVSVIEKYSPGQTAWARRRCGITLPQLNGETLRRLFREPECGTVRDEGNGVTVFGTANLAMLLTGAGGHPLAPGRTVFGVGSDDTRFSREHVHLANALGEEPGRSWYRPADPGYPALPRPGVIEVQATFLEHEACFAWQEWCVAAGPGEPVPHHSLRGAYGGQQAVMVNRKAHPAGYGTKEPGVAWCFRTEIALS
jgi:hypothetical protein